MVETFETLVYRQKQALQEWKNAVGSAASGMTQEIEDAVWELLLLCADTIIQPSSDTDEEIRKVAGDLAEAVLKTADVRVLHDLYRSRLMNAILHHITVNKETTIRIVNFSNLISDAYRESYANRLRRTISTQRASRLSEELHLAKSIQERLLPKAIPNIPGFEVAGRVIPASDVGGDYWSVKYYEEDGVVTVKLADISGHGIAAATLVAAVKFISGGYYRGSRSAHEVIERTNRVLVLETPVEILVTMVYGWIYPDTKEIDIVNAGHEPVFICNSDACVDVPPTGPLLGVTEGQYGEQRSKMEPGDILFFCSDGITEAGFDELYGTRRVKDVVAQNRNLSASEIADAVIQDVTDYAGKPRDDMSLVVIKAVDETT